MDINVGDWFMCEAQNLYASISSVDEVSLEVEADVFEIFVSTHLWCGEDTFVVKKHSNSNVCIYDTHGNEFIKTNDNPLHDD